MILGTRCSNERATVKRTSFAGASPRAADLRRRSRLRIELREHSRRTGPPTPQDSPGEHLSIESLACRYARPREVAQSVSLGGSVTLERH